MPLEGPPTIEQQEPVSFDQAAEAYRRGDRELFGAWYAQRQEQADVDPHSLGRFNLSVDVARIQLGAGDIEGAKETIDGVSIAVQQELIELDRHDSPFADMPGKDEYAGKLKNLFQNIVHLRNEIRR